jgi:hypothetical protein
MCFSQILADEDTTVEKAMCSVSANSSLYFYRGTTKRMLKTYNALFRKIQKGRDDGETVLMKTSLLLSRPSFREIIDDSSERGTIKRLQKAIDLVCPENFGGRFNRRIHFTNDHMSAGCSLFINFSRTSSRLCIARKPFCLAD